MTKETLTDYTCLQVQSTCFCQISCVVIFCKANGRSDEVGVLALLYMSGNMWNMLTHNKKYHIDVSITRARQRK